MNEKHLSSDRCFFIGYAVEPLALAMGSVKRVRKRKAYPNGLVRKHDTKCDPGMAAIVFAVLIKSGAGAIKKLRLILPSGQLRFNCSIHFYPDKDRFHFFTGGGFLYPVSQLY